MGVGKSVFVNYYKMDKNNVNPLKSQTQPKLLSPVVDLKQLWLQSIANWHWFVISVITFVVLAGLYIWFTPTTVSVSGKMVIIDKSKKNSGLSAGMAMLNSLPMGLGSALGGSLGGSFAIDSEKEIMTSNSLVCSVIKDLDLYTEYRLSEWGRKTLLYQNQPINVTLDPAHVEWFDSELPVIVHKIKLSITKDSKGYSVETMLKENKKKYYLPDQDFASLPATIKTDVGILTITENKALSEKDIKKYADGYTLKVEINAPMETADNFLRRLAVEPPSKKVTNILAISITDENVKRGIDFVNHLVGAYNQRANDDKNEEARKTDEFVNARLARVDAELGSSDADWEKYKKQFQITVPEVDAEEVMTKKSLYETQLVEIGTQLQLHDYLNEYINDPANLYEIIPLSIGASSVNSKGGDNSAVATQSASLIAQHNSYVSQRRDFLKSMSEKAPQVQRLTESIQELQPVIKTAMKRDRQSILMKRSNVEREYSRYMGRVGNAPQQERVLTEIGRQREIKQGVYLIMLQKREETAMELANVADKGKLINTATLVKNSARPQKKLVLISFLFFGMLLPLVVIYLLSLFRDKIDTLKDIASVSNSPVIGEIPLVNQVDAIRNLRTNLLLGLEKEQKVLLVASESQGDGKTYIAKQLAESLTAIGKKALYWDLDLRSNTSLKAHPADILASEDFITQMNDARANNDYVIIDTPAIGKYNDVYQIAKFVDATCYVVKVGATSKSAIEKLNKDSRLKNVYFVLNAIDMTKKKYKCYYKHILTSIAALLLFSACGSSEKVAYVQNADQLSIESNKVLFDARIMPKDILTVTVTTIDPEAAIPFNLSVPTTVTQAGGKNLASQPVLQDYLVANDGTIDFPIIGEIKVGGLTKKECESMILEKIRPYMSETEKPIVTVRMSSYSISVLGEVSKPGSFPVSREKINIFEALAMAGDMTIYGVRDRVRLIREDGSGKKEIHTLDLTDANVINSPYYYLQQNDIIYVEPSKVKKQDARVGSMTNLWFSATSIIVSVASLLVNILR